MATPRIPTPAELAARIRPLAAGGPVLLPVRREGEPAPTAPFRERWEWAVKHSMLHHRTRHVALTVATWADYETGAMPPGRAPGVPTLSAATGMGHITVRKALHDLADAGFLQRVGAPGGGATVDLTLTLPVPPG